MILAGTSVVFLAEPKEPFDTNITTNDLITYHHLEHQIHVLAPI
jgi:hypothetical protein